jgi:hypothetical protein
MPQVRNIDARAKEKISCPKEHRSQVDCPKVDRSKVDRSKVNRSKGHCA